MLSALVFALALFACATAPAAETPPSPQTSVTEVHPDTISYFEPLITMPPGAGPLDAYDRYYAMERIDDRAVVRGVFLLRSAFGEIDRGGMAALDGHPNVYRGASDDLPIVADGGCSVVSMYFDTLSFQFRQLEANAREHITRPAVCNGEA